MTLIAPVSIAQSQARQNLKANLLALGSTQPDLRSWVEEQNLPVEWVAGRDGFLTALDEAGQWVGGCSLPQRAAESMLKKLDIKGAVAGFLAPTHAAQLVAALKRMRPEQAVVAIVPEMRDLAFIFHCHNFNEEIASHRLWFAAGPAWEVGLQRIFDNHLGLATPTQFIRMQDADASQIEQLIASAQKVISEVGAARSELSRTLRESTSRTSLSKPKVCVVAPSKFRLWNDVGDAMLRIFDNQTDLETLHFDADDPASSSPLALLKAARECSAIFTANTSRTDLPGLIPDDIPWITWATTARIPSSTLAGIDDHLVVVDPALCAPAIQSGWPESRVHIGTWRQAQVLKDETSQNLLVIADTSSVETPEDLIDYSSHIVLWEAIRNDLRRDPFSLTDVSKFLNDRMHRLGVGEEAFSRNRFIEKLIVPAYQQSLARVLIQAKMPVKLYGQGWDCIDEFKGFSAGPILSREQMSKAMSEASALVHVWPTGFSHPIDFAGLPVVRRDRKGDGLVRDARLALSGKLAANSLNTAAISSQLLHTILRKHNH